MSQNNPASWTNNEWKFSYEIPEQESGLPGQLSPIGTKQQSPLDMLGSFGEALFTGIFDTLGNIFNGIVEIGGSLVGGLVEGVKSLIGWVGSTIASLLSGGTPRVPPPPIYSEIRTDLEGDLKPFVDAFKESQDKAFQAVADAEALRELFDENQKIVSDRIDEADEKIQQVGDVDAKISAEAGRILEEVETHRLATEVALGKAETASEDLAAYKREADAKIQSALKDSKAGLDKLEILEPQIEAATKDLSDYKAIIDPKIQDALRDSQAGLDQLVILEPKVTTAISDLEEYKTATDTQIQSLLLQSGEALEDAGKALENYDDLLEDHEVLKTDTKDKIAALNSLTAGQGEQISAAEAKANAAITGTVIEYAVGTSETTAPTTGWSTSTPTRAAGRFTWMRSKVTYGSGEVVTTSAALITGNTGTPGTPGTDGTPGKAGLGLKSTTVTYVTSTSGATAPTSGWNAAVPTLTKGRYLWTKTLWTYTDNSTEIGYSVAYLAKDGSSGTDGLPGKDGVGITGTAITYAKSSSGTSAPTSGWVASPPAGTPGQFIWTKTVWTYSDKTTETGYTVGKIGNTGAQGAPGGKGADGIPGKDGVGVKTTVITYALSTSGTTAPTSGWNAAVPTLTKGRYLWTKTLWTYTDNSTETGHSVSYVPTDGSSGTDGLPGKDGVGITGTAITYAKSSSGTSAPTTGWGAQPPATSPGDFVWTKTVWTYSDKTTETGYTVGKIGNTGPQGVPGTKGTDGKPTYTWIKYADTAAGVGISNDPTGKLYIGFAYNKTIATESSAPGDYTWSLVKGEQGDKGVPGAKGADGQVTYTWIKYSDNANGSGLYDTPKASTKFIGIAVNKTTATESSTASNYTWSQFKGDAGADGDDGVSITAVTSYYRLVTKGTSAPAKPTTATPSGWSTTEPNFQANRELYRVEKITYSDKTFSYTGVSKVSAYTAANKALALGGFLANPGGEITPKLENGDPTWTEGKAPSTYRPSEAPTGGKAWHTGSFDDPGMWDHAPGVTYDVSFWVQHYAGDSGSISSHIYDERGWVAHTETVNLAAGRTEFDGTSGSWNGIETLGGWRYVAWRFKISEDPTIERLYFRFATNGGDNAFRIYDFKIHSSSPLSIGLLKAQKEAQSTSDALASYRLANDPLVEAANSAAAVAAGVAQAKGEVIYQSTAPTGSRAITANLWIRKSDNKPHTYNGTKWVEVTDKVATDAADKAATALSTAQVKTTTYYGSSTPSGTKTAGDLWLDSGSDNVLKRWSGSAWVVVRDGQLAKALKAADDAQSTADGKVRTFAQSTAPTGMVAADVGDLWLDTDDGNKMYRWSGSKWVTMQDHLAAEAAAIPGMKESLNIAHSKAEGAQSTVDNLVVGGRNLLLASNPKLGQPSGYPWGRLTLTESLIEGEIVTISIKGTLPEGRTSWMVFNSGGWVSVASGGSMPPNNEGIVTWTGPWKISHSTQTISNTHITVYGARSTTEQSNFPGDTYVEWIKLERGSKATDWTPAPEDVDAEIEAQANALAGYQLSNDKAVDDAKDAAQAAAGLAGGKGEVIYSTTTPPSAKRSVANLWIKGPNNTPHVWNGSAWTEITDQAAKDAAKAAADANTLAKTKTTTYYQTSAPSGTKTAGDLWIDQSTAGKNALKRWSGSAWVVVQDKAIAEAMAAAGTAQSTADGKVQTFAQTSAPTGVTSKDVGDLWIDTDDGNKLWRWSGSKWVSLQDKGIVSARELAQQGVDAAKIVADKIPGLSSNLETLSSSQKTLGEKAQKGIDDAKTVSDLMERRVEIGASLIALVPGTTRPGWADSMEPATEAENPEGLPNAYVHRKNASSSYTQRVVKATDETKYRVSFWAKASVAGSAMVFDSRSTEVVGSNTLAFAGNEAVEGAANPGDSGRVFWINNVPTKWTYYESIKTPSPGLNLFYIGTRYWNHTAGTRRDADQFIADLRIEPVIPSQDDVNKLLIDTAANHDEILKAQGEINDIHAGNWESQSALNTLQLEIDENQNTAIQGLAAATSLAFPHLNVAPENSAGRPWWSIGMDVNSTLTPPGFPSGPSYYTSKSDIVNVDPEALIPVVPGIDYKVEFWYARVDEGTAAGFTDLRDAAGKQAITHWADITGSPATPHWRERNYAGWYLGDHKDWERKVLLLRVKPGVDKVALRFSPGGSATTNGTRVRFWGAHMSAFMPIQEALDAVQTDAILALDKINDSQDGLIAANNKAVNAAKDATVAHQRILSMAYPDPSSVIPMVPGGVNTGTVAKPVYEAMPAWLEACTRVTNDVPPGGTVAAREVGAKQISPNFENAVAIDSNISYRFSFWVRADRINSQMVIAVNSSAGGGIVESVSETTGIKYPASSSNDYLFDTRLGSANLPTSWTKVEGTVKFKEGTKDFKVSSIYFSHSTGVSAAQYLADFELYPEIPRQSDVNKALADVNAAQTAILTGHQNVLDMAFPNTSLVPMVDGAPVWASTVGANPARTPEGNWLFTSGTAIQPGTGSKHVPTVNGLVYRAIAKVRRTSSGTSFSIRIRKAGGATNVTRTAVTNKPALPGATRKDFITTTGNVSAAVNVWETWYYDFTLANNTGDVRIGYTIGSVGVEVAQFDVVALLPDQTEVNRINNEINTAQTDILHDHQRALDLMYPADNIIPRDPAGLNVGTETKPQYVEFPYWLKNGIYSVQSAGSLPAGNRLSARATTGTTPNTIGPRASVTPGVDYNYEFYFKAAKANSGLVIYLVDQNGSTGPGEWNVADGGYSTSSEHLWWNANMPGGTGPETGGFYRMSGKIRFKPGVTGISLERIYYNWSTGAVTTTQELTGIRIWPDIPSQQQVDEAQNEAVEGNKKSIAALERTVRLSFPHINTLPYSGGNPIWQSRSSWVTRTTVAANLPPMGQRTEAFSSLINGTGTMTRNAASSVDIPDDVTELRIRGLLRSNGGFFPTVDLHNDAGVSIISSWRRTFPTDEEVSLHGKSEIWYGGSAAGGYSVDISNPDPWHPFDIVVQLKSGSKNFHIKLSSNSLIAVHGLAVFSYYPSQSEVDFAQDRAMRALSGSVDLAASIGTAAATAAENLGIAQTAMQMSLVTTASYIPRVMIIKDLGNRSAHERSEHVQVRKDGTSTFLIDARGSSWTGLIVVTTFYGSNMVTDTFEITPGGSRTNGVPKRVSNEDAKHIRIDYWVDPAVETEPVSLGGTDVPHNKWVELAGTSFTATGFVPDQGPALPVLHIAELAVGWDRATHHAKYGVRIKLAGKVVATLEETKVGPRYPWGEPYAKQVVTWSGQVMPNQKITFEVLANDTVPSQRRLRDAKRLVSYSKGV